MKQVSLGIENLQVRLYNEVAVARALYRSSFEYNGEPTDQTFVRTDVVVRIEGTWQIVTSQTTQRV